jgi:hypothetical protein
MVWNQQLSFWEHKYNALEYVHHDHKHTKKENEHTKETEMYLKDLSILYNQWNQIACMTTLLDIRTLVIYTPSFLQE